MSRASPTHRIEVDARQPGGKRDVDAPRPGGEREADARKPRLEREIEAPRPGRARAIEALPAPLVWTFDGPFERCLDDLDDSLRRAIVLIGDVARVAVLIDLSLPALLGRVRAGDTVQPAWGRLTERIAGYGLPTFPRVRHLRAPGPLATLVVAYRS